MNEENLKNPKVSKSLPGLYHTQGDRVVEALMKLYLKIQQVEQAYAYAKSETTTKSSDAINTNTNKFKNAKCDEVHESLAIAEARCELLEKQLRHVRSMLTNSEKFKEMTALHSETDKVTISPNSASTTVDLTSEKAAAPLKYTPTRPNSHSSYSPSTVIQSRKPNVFHKNKRGSKHHSKETTSCSPDPSGSRHPLIDAQKRAKSLSDLLGGASRTKSKNTFINDHYHLHLSDIPFVLGTATSASHSIIANIQNFIAMLKQHNPRICSTVGNQNLRAFKMSSPRSRSPRRNISLEASVIMELKDLIQGLEVEHDIISDDKDKLTEQLQHADLSEVKTLQRDLEALSIRLSVKEEQIGRLKTVQLLLEENMRYAFSQNSPVDPVHSKNEKRASESPAAKNSKSKISSNRKCLLSELRHLQSTLKKEQLSWK